MSTTTRILGGIATLTAIAAFTHAGPASATDFEPVGTCHGTAVVHETKAVAATLHTWQFTVNGYTFPANTSVDGYEVLGHPATVTVVGRYWRAANADTNTREDAGNTTTKPVHYPTNCGTTPPPGTTTPPTSSTAPTTTAPTGTTGTTAPAAPPSETLPPTGKNDRGLVAEVAVALLAIAAGTALTVRWARR